MTIDSQQEQQLILSLFCLAEKAFGNQISEGAFQGK